MNKLIAGWKALLEFIKHDGSKATSGSRNPLIWEGWKGYWGRNPFNFSYNLSQTSVRSGSRRWLLWQLLWSSAWLSQFHHMYDKLCDSQKSTYTHHFLPTTVDQWFTTKKDHYAGKINNEDTIKRLLYAFNSLVLLYFLVLCKYIYSYEATNFSVSNYSNMVSPL